MISPESVDRILQAAQIEDVVSDFVKLKKRGINLLGLCPFHNEKTPSFTVSPVKGIFKCFGCGKSGNSVGFIMEHEGLSYPDALRYLAGKYHIDVEEDKASPEAQQQRTERESLYILLSAAQRYYNEQLKENEEGRTVGMPYFRERGLEAKTIESFGLGWSPVDREAFSKWALKNGYNKDVLVKSGMAIETQDGRLFDRFHERAMFPIQNLSGKVIGFGGRIIRSNAKEAKYINSPETEVYNKSQVLYGMFQAKKAIRQMDACVLVEGYMDVISMHQAGVENVVASSGTSLTEDQLRLIKRFTDNIIFFFDGDEAGKKAAVRALDMALTQEMNPKVVTLPAEHDPDSFARTNAKEAIEDFLKTQAKDFLQFRIGLLQPEQRNDPLARAQTAKELLSAVLMLKDGLKRAFYIKEIEKAIGLEEKLLYEELRRMQVSKYREENKAQDVNIPLPEPPAEQPRLQDTSSKPQEIQVIRLLLHHGHKPFSEELTVSQHIIGELDEIVWEDPGCEKIFEAFRLAVAENRYGFNSTQLLQGEDTLVQSLVTDMLIEAYSLSENWKKMLGRPIASPQDNFVEEIHSAIHYIKLRKIQQLIRENQDELKKASTEEEQTELVLIKKHLDDMKREIASDRGITLL